MLHCLRAFVLAAALLSRPTTAISDQERSGLQFIKVTFLARNGNSDAGLKTAWKTGDLADVCNEPVQDTGVECDEDGNVVAMRTQYIFKDPAPGASTLFAASDVLFTQFPNLGALVVDHKQMTGTFDVKLPPNLVALVIDGSNSLSSTGGYKMVGQLPPTLLEPLDELLVLFLQDLPGLTGPLPSMSTLTKLDALRIVDVKVSGPLPNAPFDNTPRTIFIDRTLLAGAVPDAFCKSLSTVATDDENSGVVILDNPLVTSLPECLKTCTGPTPVRSTCAVIHNSICDVGQNSGQDVVLFAGMPPTLGAAADNCTAASTSNPCFVSRDRTDCVDCAGNAGGTFAYDFCGVCNDPALPENRNTCLDCRGVPHGTALYDLCGVCMGDADTCDDCDGAPAGTALETCGYCGAPLQACDCAGTLFGTAQIDVCGVCGGDGLACRDCAGTPYGLARVDVCGVCGGDLSTCRDCLGVPAGSAVYDRCDVCNGGNRECDCRGVPLGFSVFDACDVCEGDGSSCADCRGVPNGPATYDVCDVCDGTDRVGVCENPPPDTSLIRGVQQQSANVLILIAGVLAMLCCVISIVLAFTWRRHRDQVEPLEQRLNMRRGGGAPWSAFTLLGTLAVLSATAVGPVDAVLPDTTAFLGSLETHSTVASVYPEWVALDGFIEKRCRAGMVGLQCAGDEIVGVNLRRPLVGFYTPTERQFLSFLPLATTIRIVRSPSFTFYATGIGNATRLRHLELVDTGLAGVLPEDIAGCATLTSLAIVSAKRLDGTLPAALGELTMLRMINITETILYGIDAPAYGNLAAVKAMRLVNNGALGTLPAAIGGMESLEELRISSTQLGGSIPSEFRQLSLLRVLDLNGNFHIFANQGLFDGTAGPLQDSLVTLQLDSNFMAGPLPNLAGYTALRHVTLSHNRFDSDPAGVDGFFLDLTGTELLLLDASYNQFTQLKPLLSNPFIGACTFVGNPLCASSTIAPYYVQADCELGLLPLSCPPTCGDTSCLDCLGVAGGFSIYDLCDVCAGDDTTCLDCAGVPNGPSMYDVCDVCAGDGLSCLDCAGEPFGAAFYDGCDVCGDGSAPLACADCAGVPNGASTYDQCDVCNGHGQTCIDCAGTLNGSAVRDECGVCAGDGLTCAPPLVVDYINAQGSFGLFVLLAILLALLVVLAALLTYLIFNL